MAGTSMGARKGWLTRRNLYGITGRSGAVGHGVKNSLSHPRTDLFDIGKVMSAADRAPKLPKRAHA